MTLRLLLSTPLRSLLACWAAASIAWPARADADAMAAGEAAARRGDTVEAARQYDQAYRSFEATLGAQHPDTLASLRAAATAYGNVRDYQRQRALNERLLEVLTQLLGPRHPDTLQAMSNVAQSHRGLGQFDQALALNEAVVKLRREVLGERHPDTLTTLSNLATAYTALGRYNERLAVVQRVLALRTEVLGERHPDTITTMGAIARTYAALGRSAEALALNETVVRMQTEILGARHPDTRVSMNSLAINYAALGRFADARTMFEKLLRQDIEELGERHHFTLMAMNNLSGAYHGLGLTAEEVAVNEKLLELRTAVLGPRHPDTLLSMSNLAAGYRTLGRHEEALALHGKTLELRTGILGDRHPDTLNSLGQLALTYSALGRHADALALNERSFELHSAILGLRHPETLNSMSDLVRAYDAIDRRRDAVSLAEPYISGAEWQRSQPGLSAENRRSIFQNYSQGYRRFSIDSGLVGELAQGFRLAELGKARTLLDSMTAQLAGRSGALPAARQAELDELIRQIAAHEELVAQARSAEVRLDLEAARNALVRQYEAVEALLKLRYPKYAQLREPRVLEAASLRDVVPADAVAVSYLALADDSVAAWLVDASGQFRFADLGRLPHLADAVETLRRAGSHPKGLSAQLEEDAQRAWRSVDGSYRLLDANAAPPDGAVPVTDGAEVASYLSRTLLAPLAGALRGKAKWIVSPDGPLAQLPFELLSLEGRRVLEAVELHYAQSLSVYALARARQREYRSLKRPMDLLALGDPEYGAGVLPASQRRARFRSAPVLAEEQLGGGGFAWPALPGTAVEIRAIRQLLPNGNAYLRAEASEAHLQQMNLSGELRNYRMLHFAVHGSLSTQDPALSSLVLSQKNLASGTDGYITAAEWPGYDLRSDLTVLSACETGLGRNLSGEGVMGLPFALFLAGNVNTVLSLWPVLDNVTPVFMRKFYGHIKAGQSASRALTRTKREMAADPSTRNPVNWAPFILVGAG